MNKSAVLDSNDFKLALNARIYKNYPVVNNVILHVTVNSDGFTGVMDMDVGATALDEFVEQIHSMNVKMKGSAAIKETYGESFIRMEFDKTGHIIVRGYMNTFFHKLHFENKPANILQAFFLLFSKVFPYQEF